MAIQTSRSTRGMATAPHSLASESACAVLREGGNAIEAMIAAAATISVVYPHMNGIGGDSFWLIHEPGKPVTTIDACGQAAQMATREWYAGHSVSTIPFRGPLAANTVAGTVGGWGLAQQMSGARFGGRLPLSRLLADAIHHARHGHPVTHSYTATTRAKLAEVRDQPGFAERFLQGGDVPQPGTLMVQSSIGATLERIAAAGTGDFYTGELASSITADLKALGSPVGAPDLIAYAATERPPLHISHSRGTLYNMAPPTQGMVALAILGIADRLGLDSVEPESAAYLHRMVEATKQAFFMRDRYVTDPRYMTVEPQSLLTAAEMDKRAARVDLARALPWPAPQPPSDTVWMGVIDGEGRAVSFIQSIYHEFGSGLVLSGTGINWQNRGASFSLDPTALNTLEPGRKPFHTLNPALAHLKNPPRSGQRADALAGAAAAAGPEAAAGAAAALGDAQHHRARTHRARWRGWRHQAGGVDGERGLRRPLGQWSFGRRSRHRHRLPVGRSGHHAPCGGRARRSDNRAFIGQQRLEQLAVDQRQVAVAHVAHRLMAEAPGAQQEATCRAAADDLRVKVTHRIGIHANGLPVLAAHHIGLTVLAQLKVERAVVGQAGVGR